MTIRLTLFNKASNEEFRLLEMQDKFVYLLKNCIRVTVKYLSHAWEIRKQQIHNNLSQRPNIDRVQPAN